MVKHRLCVCLILCVYGCLLSNALSRAAYCPQNATSNALWYEQLCLSLTNVMPQHSSRYWVFLFYFFSFSVLSSFFFYILSYQMSMNTRFALQTFFFFCRSCFLLELYSSFWMEDDWKRRQGLSTGKAWFRLCRSTDRKCSKEPSETVNHLLYHPGMTARLFQVYIALGRHQKVNIENTNVALRSMISLCLYHTAVCKCYVFTNKQLDFF